MTNIYQEFHHAQSHVIIKAGGLVMAIMEMEKKRWKVMQEMMTPYWLK